MRTFSLTAILLFLALPSTAQVVTTKPKITHAPATTGADATLSQTSATANVDDDSITFTYKTSVDNGGGNGGAVGEPPPAANPYYWKRSIRNITGEFCAAYMQGKMGGTTNCDAPPVGGCRAATAGRSIQKCAAWDCPSGDFGYQKQVYYTCTNKLTDKKDL